MVPKRCRSCRTLGDHRPDDIGAALWEGADRPCVVLEWPDPDCGREELTGPAVGERPAAIAADPGLNNSACIGQNIELQAPSSSTRSAPDQHPISTRLAWALS